VAGDINNNGLKSVPYFVFPSSDACMHALRANLVDFWEAKNFGVCILGGTKSPALFSHGLWIVSE
jgi:hypothetical protein